MKLGQHLWLLITLILAGCDEHSWNDPYPKESITANTLYTAFTVQPKVLDPARTYSENEISMIMQIYEPTLEYNYLIRPYELQTLTAVNMPNTSYDPKANITTYTIRIKPGIKFQPHPAFATDSNGKYVYHNMTYDQGIKYNTLFDFKQTATRDLTAPDYVYQIKRLVDPKISSPVYGMLSPYIVGMDDLRQRLAAAYKLQPTVLELDMRNYEFAGARVIDENTYTVQIHGKYPQFRYWLAMNFFAPMPWEAIQFYNQPGLIEHNISINWYPIGTGPFYITENNPEKRIVMQRNPNYHAEYYPSVGMAGDAENGLLDLAGQKLPFLDKIIYSLEKESIPYWDKFLQGYYDSSGISSDNFNSVISSNTAHGLQLSEDLLKRNYRLAVADMPVTRYWGFNMLDNVIGGYSASAVKLRTAISLVFDIDEYIAIFANGRGIAASGPIPPGIFGYKLSTAMPNAEKLLLAKNLLAEAGYPNGIDSRNGQPLQINFDIMSSGDPGMQALLAWVRKQMAKLDIELNVRATDYNRYQEKMNTGNVQMYMWGWNADYPDPENFLFMFYGPNGKVTFAGENASNYSNPKYDRLYDQFKTLEDSPQKLNLVNQMLAILNQDMPWVWGYFPQAFGLYSPWYHVTKPSGVQNNTLKYVKIDPELRAKLRQQWNKPLLLPLVLILCVLILISVPALVAYSASQNKPAKRTK